jgi:hypothetical protein
VSWGVVSKIGCCVVAWCAVLCSVVKCRGVPCGKLDVVKWRGVPSRGVTRSDENLDWVQIRAVNAPIVADGELVATCLVTAAADGCDGPVGQKGVDE